MVPLINIIFLLLIFFMITATGMRGNMDVDLPQAKSVEKNTAQSVTLSVGLDGSIEMDGREVEIESLLVELKENLKKRGYKAVVIRADQNIEFDLFGKIIDIASQAGVTEFLLATELPETADPAHADELL